MRWVTCMTMEITECMTSDSSAYIPLRSQLGAASFASHQHIIKRKTFSYEAEPCSTPSSHVWNEPSLARQWSLATNAGLWTREHTTHFCRRLARSQINCVSFSDRKANICVLRLH